MCPSSLPQFQDWGHILAMRFSPSALIVALLLSGAVAQDCRRTVVLPLTPNLVAGDYEATLNGQPIGLGHLSQIHSARAVVLVRSGLIAESSWNKNNKWRREALRRAFATHIPADTSIAFGVFDQVVQFSSFSSDPEEIRSNFERVSRVNVSGNPNLDDYAGLDAALQYLEYPVLPKSVAVGTRPELKIRPTEMRTKLTRPGDFIVLVVNSMGGYGISQSAEAEMKARFLQDGVAVWIYIAGDLNQDNEEQNSFIRLASATGGGTILLPSFDNEKSVGEQSEQYDYLNAFRVASGYTAEVVFPVDTKPKLGGWVIKLTDAAFIRSTGKLSKRLPLLADLLLCTTTKKGEPLFATTPEQ